MRYIDALRKYNEGKDKWCFPKKGTPDYLQIINMMKKNSDISDKSDLYSHSFTSKSSDTNAPRSRDYEIVKNNPKIYLINAVGDGDCFINAIFDYCLYTGTLEAMYNRMIHIELLIASKYAKYGEGIKKAKELFSDFTIQKYENDKKGYSNIISKSLVKVDDTDVPPKYSKLSKMLRYFIHPSERKRGDYDKERRLFSKAMKYMQVLYVYTFGKNIFLNRLNRYMDIAISADGVDVLDWDNTLINYVKNKYYHRRTGKLKASIDVNILLDEYMKIYAETNGYFTGDDQIFIFRKILFKKINLKNTSDNKAVAIPRFWLNYETIQSVSNLTKIVKFRKTAGTYKFIEKDGGIYKYISLLRDGEHYLLFVAKKFLIL